MSKDDEAFQLRQRAMELQSSDPKEALRILKDIIARYPRTRTVTDLVVDDIITVCTANRMWVQAVEACQTAQTIRPDNAPSYALEAKACRLDQEGRAVDATEARLEKDTLHGRWFGTLRTYGDLFASLGANDRAWALYHEAVSLALAERKSPHATRESMASLLLTEGKPDQAAETLIEGVCEATRFSRTGAPKSLTASLKRSLEACGIPDQAIFTTILKQCESTSAEKATETFRKARAGLAAKAQRPA
jgi:hypothetical protein